MVVFGFVLIRENLGQEIVGSLVFGLIGIGLLLLGFKIFDWMTPRLHLQTELGEKQNVALAIVMGAYFLAIAYIIAHVVAA